MAPAHKHHQAHHHAHHTGHRVLTDAQIANVVFNETRSLSGDGIDQARVNIAHTIINAMGAPGGLPLMSTTMVHVLPGEKSTYDGCVSAVTTARANVSKNTDPTGGATHFNFRPNATTGPFQGHALRTNSGPFSNSYPTPALPSTNIHANTYQ